MPTMIYVLSDPRVPGSIRYVGKTTSGLPERLRQHIASARRGDKSHRNHWIASLDAAAVRPLIVCIEVVAAEADWQERERYWIAFYRAAGHPLVNNSGGGDGQDSAGWRRYWSDPVHRAAQSEKLGSHCAKPDVRAAKRAASVRYYSDPAHREYLSRQTTAGWNKPGAKQRAANGTKRSWADPIKRARRIAGLKAAAERRRSSINQEVQS